MSAEGVRMWATVEGQIMISEAALDAAPSARISCSFCYCFVCTRLSANLALKYDIHVALTLKPTTVTQTDGPNGHLQKTSERPVKDQEDFPCFRSDRI